MASADTSNNEVDEFVQLQEILEKASDLKNSQINDEDIVIFIGTTKAGKSSLINHIIGNKLIGEKNFASMPIAIKKFDDSDGPQIGRGSSSETIIPTRWENKEKLPGLALWDAPGFNDNRGPIQDIINAYYIYNLFRNVKSVKLVLVTDINDIMNDCVNSFLMLLNALESILKEKMADHFSSVVVIFTKVPKAINGNAANISTIQELLNDQFFRTSNICMSENSRKFLKYLINGNKKIGIFKKAGNGLIGDSISVGIIEAILEADKVPDYVLKEVASPSIAHESKVFLLESRQELSSIQAFYELQDVINCVCENFVKQYTNIQDAEDSRDNLESIIKELSDRADQIKRTLEPTASFQTKLEILEKLDTKIANKIEADKLLLKSTLMEFVDSILGLKESQDFSMNLQHIAQNVVQKIDELIITIRLKINEIEKEEFNKEAEKMQEKYKHETSQLRADLEEKVRLNQISTEEFKRQINDFQRKNAEVTRNLETEKANNAKEKENLWKMREDTQAQNSQIINDLNIQLANLQTRNEEIVRLINDYRPPKHKHRCIIS